MIIKMKITCFGEIRCLYSFDRKYTTDFYSKEMDFIANTVSSVEVANAGLDPEVNN